MIGTRQYRRMENNGTNILKDKESMDIVAAGKIRERETNAPDQFKAPRAAEEREANAPCQRETAENMGTQETNMCVGEGGRHCEERRRSADHRGSTAAAGGLGGQQAAQSDPEGNGHRSCSTDSRPGSW
ncbi:MAG: hypothetical protein ACK56F_18915 [bacterium]